MTLIFRWLAGVTLEKVELLPGKSFCNTTELGVFTAYTTTEIYSFKTLENIVLVVFVLDTKSYWNLRE